MKRDGNIILFDYKLSDQKSDNPAVLCSLEGYVTYTGIPNRNKRLYPEGFWSGVLDDERIKEMIDTKTFFGEAKHPGQADTPYVEIPTTSHAIRSFKVDKKGVWAVIDVLNTERGRAVKALIDYGSKLGMSTRAFGDQEEDKDGNFTPIRDKYKFVTWDFITFPAFSDARPALADSVLLDMPADFDPESIKMGVTKEEFSKSLNDMAEPIAQALSDYTGVPYEPSSHKKITALKQDLEGAVARIISLEKTLNDQKMVEDPAKAAELKQISDQLDTANKTLEGIAKNLADKEIELQTVYKLNDEISASLNKIKSETSKGKQQLIQELEATKKVADDATALADELTRDLATSEQNHAEEIVEKNFEYRALSDQLIVLQEQLQITETQLRDAKVIKAPIQDSAPTSTPEPETLKPLFEEITIEIPDDTGITALISKLKS